MGEKQTSKGLCSLMPIKCSVCNSNSSRATLNSCMHSFTHVGTGGGGGGGGVLWDNFEVAI